MFGKIREFFKTDVSLEVDAQGKPTEYELVVAAAVLLVEIAQSDSSVVSREAEAVCSLLQAEFGIDDDAIPELVEIAVAAREEQGKIDAFLEVINQHFSQRQRQRILAMVWKVIRADNKIDPSERTLAELVRNRLKLSEKLADEAKIQSAEMD